MRRGLTRNNFKGHDKKALARETILRRALLREIPIGNQAIKNVKKVAKGDLAIQRLSKPRLVGE